MDYLGQDVALGILEPTQNEIVRQYAKRRIGFGGGEDGFSPRAAAHGEVVKAAVEAGASEVELQDMTEEMG